MFGVEEHEKSLQRTLDYLDPEISMEEWCRKYGVCLKFDPVERSQEWEDCICDDEYVKVSYEICRYHHERYDGKGYPDGIKGDSIPLSAQCESIADVYDALVTESVYKAAYSKEEAFNMIIQGECGIFSPKLMEAFRKSREEFEDFLDNHTN